MADTYSKLLGLSETPTPPVAAVKENPGQASSTEKNTRGLANQQTRKPVKQPSVMGATGHIRKDGSLPVSPPRTHTMRDTSLLTTKEKTKYGTYLTDDSIEKIRIRAIQTKRDDHQVLQEAVNHYFDALEQ